MIVHVISLLNILNWYIFFTILFSTIHDVIPLQVVGIDDIPIANLVSKKARSQSKKIKALILVDEDEPLIEICPIPDSPRTPYTHNKKC